jgi:DNA-binding response OmpR family regulator
LKKKVLIIENDEQIKDIVTFILESEDFEVIGAKYITEGHMLCKQIKLISALAHVPVIIFSTAYNIKDIVKTCGADGYVQKPFELDNLMAEIKRFLTMGAESIISEE